jgi:predicted Zn-dependent peptidase
VTDPPVFPSAQFRLANGARAVLFSRPRSPTLAVQLFMRAGSRHDGAHPGLAHLVEHLVFRAPTPPRLDLYAAVESLGGEVGGGTTRDLTSFEIVVGAPHAARALAFLPHLARAPAIDPTSFQGEQLVVCQELRERASPPRSLWNALLAALWASHPLVHDPGGTPEGVLTATPAAAERYRDTWYHPSRLLVVAAGACAPADFAGAVEAALGPLPSTLDRPLPVEPDAAPPAAGGSTPPAPVAPDGSIVNLAIGIAVPGLEHADCAALRLLDVALGHGPHSRLPRAVAARGLSVRVQSQYVPYWGGGAFGALASCRSEQADDVAAVLADELRGLGARPLAADEAEAARDRYEGAVYRRCETNLGLASVAGIEALFADGEPALARTVGQVMGLRPPELAAVAARHFARAETARVGVRHRPAEA